MTNNTQPFITIRNLRKTFETPAGKFEILKGIDIEFNRGEYVAVIGKSGSGKSTFINMLTGIDRPSAGTVQVGDKRIDQFSEAEMTRWRGQNLGIVFQFFQLLPTLTVVENVMLPMQINKIGTPREQEEKARALLDKMGVSEHADKLPSAISGGQQQRVAIARALINDPQLIVADEPTGNLDTKTAEEIFALFQQLARDGVTILMVTHDDDFARRVDRTIIVSDGVVVNEFLVGALRQLSKDTVMELAEELEPAMYLHDEAVVREGTIGNSFYVVSEGELEVVVEKPGGGQVVIDKRGPGQYFGEMALLGHETRTATVRVTSERAKLLEIDKPLFERLIDESPAFRTELTEIVAQHEARIEAGIQTRAEVAHA